MFNKALQSLQSGINSGITGMKNLMNQISQTTNTKSKIKINNKEYYEYQLIAEGGFGFIYEICSIETEKKYALKKINISNEKHLSQIKNEIELWKKLSEYKNIIHLYDYEITEKTVYFIMELCTEGTLLDYINKKKEIPENEILQILSEISIGIYAMHCQKKPIIHRDLKIENILKFGKNYKICDFDSSTTEIFNPKISDEKTKNKFYKDFETNSTLYYRAPEMCDKYSEYIVNEKVDIWSLGCILYIILFKIHPFKDAEKLTIISGQFTFPKNANNKYSEKILDLIRFMLCTNPEKRISSREIVLTLKNWGKINKIELPDEVINIKKRQNGEIDLLNGQYFLEDDEIKKVQEKIKNKEVGVIGNNKNLLWDFNVDDSNNNNNIESNNNNNNILDFEFIDSPKQNKNEKKNNNENILNFFQNDNSNISNNNNNNNNKELFEFVSSHNEINKNLNISNKTNNSSNKNSDYGFHFDNNNQQTISFNQMEEKKSEGTFHKQNSQDILSFFQ